MIKAEFKNTITSTAIKRNKINIEFNKIEQENTIKTKVKISGIIERTTDEINYKRNKISTKVSKSYDNPDVCVTNLKEL